MNFDVKQFSSDKILKHLDRVSAWTRGENPPPITVEFDMSNICNHRCPQCSGMYFRDSKNDLLPEGLAKKILRQLAKAAVRGLIFTGGGEPLCNPKTPAMVILARKLGMDVGFITNGALITERVAEILIQNCLWIRVSVDAASASVYKKTHGSGREAFNKLLKKIGMLVEKKRQFASAVTVGVGFLTSRYTRKDMRRAAELFKEIGVDYLQFRPMQIHNNGRFYYDLLDIEKELNEALKEDCEDFSVLFSRHKYEMMKHKDYGRNYGRCFGHQFATVVGADGKMYLCCHMRGNRKYCIGDLNKSAFKDIWNSEQRMKAVERIDFADCIPLCRDNTFNQILWNMSQPREHKNFL